MLEEVDTVSTTFIDFDIDFSLVVSRTDTASMALKWLDGWSLEAGSGESETEEKNQSLGEAPV